MLLFFKACIVHVVFDAFVTSLSMSDSQERGAGHLKKKKDVCMEYETWDLGGSKFLSVTAFPITFVFLTNLACPWAFAKKKSCLKLVEIFSGHVATKKQNYPWWNIAYKSKLQPSVSIFLGIYRRQNFEIQCRYGTKEWHHHLNWNDWMSMRHSCNIKIQWRFLVIHLTYMIVFLHFLGCLGCCLWKFHSAEHC